VKPVPLSVQTMTQNDPQSSSGRIETTVDHHSASPQQSYTQPGMSGTERSPPVGTVRTKTPIAWIKRQFQRSYSSPVVPNIQIESPSQSSTSNSSNSTRLDPVLLSPKNAYGPMALPNDIIAEATRGISILPSSTPIPNHPITIQLPDNELPLGFVPMTPIMSHSGPMGAGPNHGDSGSVFSPIPDNYSLPDPFRSANSTPIQRPATKVRSSKGELAKEDTGSPRTMSFGGHYGWASPGADSARLSRPLSIFSDD
jgi:hypothetical protein